MPHPHVPHPRDLIAAAAPHRSWLTKLNDRALDWLAAHVLASIGMFDAAFVVPLIAIPASDSVKLTLSVISGSWIQWWALPALQRSAVKSSIQSEAKADADHAAMASIHHGVDHIVDAVDTLAGVLTDTVARWENTDAAESKPAALRFPGPLDR